MIRRNASVQVALIAMSCVLGISSRWYAHALPALIAEYAGDTLWALAMFFGFGLVSRARSTWKAAGAAVAFSLLIEVSQLYHAPWIDLIRRSAIGGLILGFGFLWSDLACYAIGVGLGVVIELAIYRSERLGSPSLQTLDRLDDATVLADQPAGRQALDENSVGDSKR